MDLTKQRIRKSEALSADEWRLFLEYVKSFQTKIDAMEALNVTMPTIDRIMLKGTGRPDTIKKIREALAQKS